MREILFRGKREDNGEWAYGNLFIPDATTRKAPTEILVGTNIVRISDYVIPETVGQYTGLTDSEGNKIFEGDILKDDWGKIYEAFYTINSCSFMLCCRKCANEYEKGNYRIGEGWCNTIRIIGNIHDNKELLEVE